MESPIESLRFIAKRLSAIWRSEKWQTPFPALARAVRLGAYLPPSPLAKAAQSEILFATAKAAYLWDLRSPRCCQSPVRVPGNHLYAKEFFPAR